MPAVDQALAEIVMVVDLAVEHDRRRIVFVENRLVATRHVDDAQPAKREARNIVDQQAAVVRAAVDDRFAHSLEDVRIGSDAGNPGYSAHGCIPRTTGSLSRTDMIPRITMAIAVSPVPAVPESSLLRFSRWMLFVTVAAMPLYVVRWHYGPLPTTLLETLILITVGLYAVANRLPVATPLDLPIALLLLAGAISVVVAGDHRTALGLYRAFFVEAVAVFYVAVDVVRRPEELQRLVLAFAVGSSLFAALNLVAFAGALLSNDVHIGAAPNALYGDANYVAMYLDPPFAMAAGLVLFAHTSTWRWIGVAWFAVTGAALLLTFSKGSYLAVGALAVVAVLTVRRWGAVLLVGVVAAAVLVAQIPLVAQRLGTIPFSIGGRLEIYRATLQMIRKSPIFGVGLPRSDARGVSPRHLADLLG